MAADIPSTAAPSLADYPASPLAEARKGGWRSQPVIKDGKEESIRPVAVSVVTVVRNGVVALPRALESVRAQDVDGVEHVVVDGNSQDGTQELLLANSERIALWVSEADRGISDAFNKGIALSRGDIIGLINSDDWYEAGAIRAVVEKMQETGADIVCGNLQYWEGSQRTYLTSSDPELLSRAMTVGHPTVFVRRDCYRRHGLFRLDFKLAMDYEWLLRVKTAGARIAVVDRCLANMQGGGVGDRLWRSSQREVAKARAMHLRGADNAFAYHFYVWRRIVLGVIRRALDATGLGVLRRAYHRWLSPVRVISNRSGSKD